MHSDPHPLAGQTVQLADHVQLLDVFGQPATGGFEIEDWQDRVYGGSWMNQSGNPACLAYAARSAVANLPLDNQVVYGRDARNLAHLVHVSEIRVPGPDTEGKSTEEAP